MSVNDIIMNANVNKWAYVSSDLSLKTNNQL